MRKVELFLLFALFLWAASAATMVNDADNDFGLAWPFQHILRHFWTEILNSLKEIANSLLNPGNETHS